jgi:LysM repeat protein
MTAASSERRTMKIRRRGRHATPSQVEKAAAQAGKAAPAVAIAGALVAVPAAQQASAATPASAAASSAASQPATLDSFSATSATTAAKSSRARTYTVRSGDSLSLIAERFYHKPADWQWLAHVNARTIANPNVIYAGQRISVPYDPPASYTLTTYHARHAKPSASPARDSDGSASKSTGTTTTDNAASSSRSGYSAPSGTYTCTDLEKLWKAAGGNPGAAFTAAEIAMAESGGNPGALSPTDDYGLWQINASNGSLATFNPYENARSAIILSGNGASWSPWTTYTSGAYQGRC